jgi:hypothetical protein
VGEDADGRLAAVHGFFSAASTGSSRSRLIRRRTGIGGLGAAIGS